VLLAGLGHGFGFIGEFAGELARRAGVMAVTNRW
jgi:hypothetical protein